MSPDCLQAHPGGVLLRLRVIPNARQSEAAGRREDRLLLRIQAPPVEGKANREVCKWAAKSFKIKTSRVELLRGEKARDKDLLLRDLRPEEARARLNTLESPQDQGADPDHV